MAIYSGFSHEKWWFSIVTLVYQRVYPTICLFLDPNGVEADPPLDWTKLHIWGGAIRTA